MEHKEKAKRDNYIDFLRGIAAVSIIFIHTCFSSGENYVPEFMKSFSLAIDVPLFFFLSGWASSYQLSFEKNIFSLVGIYKRYVMFLPFFVLALEATAFFTGQSSGMSLRSLYGNLFFHFLEENCLPVVGSSMWFMPVYFTVVAIGQFLAHKVFENFSKPKILIFIGAGLLCSYWGMPFFLMSPRTLFYLFFYFAGMVCKNFRPVRFAEVVLFALVDLTLMQVVGGIMEWDIGNMQSMKFPPNIIYMLYAFLAISVAVWGRGKLPDLSPDNTFCRIGRSAILFYFCQGISSSWLCFLLPKIELFWGIKLSLAFVSNLVWTFLLVVLLKNFYRLEEKVFTGVKSVFT